MSMIVENENVMALFTCLEASPLFSLGIAKSIVIAQIQFKSPCKKVMREDHCSSYCGDKYGYNLRAKAPSNRFTSNRFRNMTNRESDFFVSKAFLPILS